MAIEWKSSVPYEIRGATDKALGDDSAKVNFALRRHRNSSSSNTGYSVLMDKQLLPSFHAAFVGHFTVFRSLCFPLCGKFS